MQWVCTQFKTPNLSGYLPLCNFFRYSEQSSYWVLLQLWVPSSFPSQTLEPQVRYSYTWEHAISDYGAKFVVRTYWCTRDMWHKQAGMHPVLLTASLLTASSTKQVSVHCFYPQSLNFIQNTPLSLKKMSKGLNISLYTVLTYLEQPEYGLTHHLWEKSVASSIPRALVWKGKKLPR